jgi:O-antigen/teichoic acid export membrane protein
MLRDQGALFAITYLVILPLLVIIFSTGLLPWNIAPWFFILVILEHISQELSRLLVVLEQQLLASWLLFIRSGLWGLILTGVFWFFPSTRSLKIILFAWTLSTTVACFLGLKKLSKIDPSSLKRNIDWGWIRKGVLIALPFLISTLALRAIFTVDRYWMQKIAGSDALAAYVLFSGISNAVFSFVESGVFVFAYPKLISAFKRKDQLEFEKSMKDLILKTSIATILMIGLAAVLIHPILTYFNKPIYKEHVSLLYVLLVATLLNAAGMIPHFGIYAMSRDKHIILSHCGGLILFIGLAYTFGKWSPTYGIPLATCGALLSMFIYKTIAYLKYKRLKFPAENQII